MAVPRNRTSNARKNARRSHHAKKPQHGSSCKNCGASIMPHRVCMGCGFYKGHQILSLEKSE